MNDWIDVWNEIDKRRRYLGWSKVELYQNTNISEATFKNIESGQGMKRIDKIRSLEEGLSWLPGSVDAILAGGGPMAKITPGAAKSRRAKVEERLTKLEDRLDAVDSAVGLLIEEVRALRAVDRPDDQPSPPAS